MSTASTAASPAALRGSSSCAALHRAKGVSSTFAAAAHPQRDPRVRYQRFLKCLRAMEDVHVKALKVFHGAVLIHVAICSTFRKCRQHADRTGGGF